MERARDYTGTLCFGICDVVKGAKNRLKDDRGGFLRL